MKRIEFLSFTLATLLVVSLPSYAVDPAPRAPKGMSKTTAPMKGPMKLTPAAIPKDMKKRTIRAEDPIELPCKSFRYRYTTYRRAVANYQTKLNQCGNMTFSIQDQQRAGCKASDTVAQCNHKLLRYCTRTQRHSMDDSWRLLRGAANNLKATIDRVMR